MELDGVGALARHIATLQGGVLFLGAPGTGKSTLVAGIAGRLAQLGVPFALIGRDPGSPMFGIPGALCRGSWGPDGFQRADLEALCSLDAGRFRLPLVFALGRLAGRASAPLCLIDGPGVVRGVAAAELLAGFGRQIALSAVVFLTRDDRNPLHAELRALQVELIPYPAPQQAHRPGRRTRMRLRTRLWDAYLEPAREQWVAAGRLEVLGTPPPSDAGTAWQRRQIALLDHGLRTLAMGEVVSRDTRGFCLRLPETSSSCDARFLLLRDAVRDAGGLLTTAPPAIGSAGYLPAPGDLVPAQALVAGGPRPAVELGPAAATLVNGVFGDPLLHLRLRQSRRSLLFDLGESGRLPARIAHQVSDVCITHAHFDHIGGFLWFLRSRIGVAKPCRVYGPPGLAGHIHALVRGILWDRIGSSGPVFEVAELHRDRLRWCRIQAGRSAVEEGPDTPVADGVLAEEPAFRLRAVTLDHGTPVLAFAFEPTPKLSVDKGRLAALQAPAGPWLNALKERLRNDDLDAEVPVPGRGPVRVRALAADLIQVGAAAKLVYATDCADTRRNRAALTEFAQDARFFFCEAAFAREHSAQARRSGHLTTEACAAIAAAAEVGLLIPFHFSRRYEQEPERIYGEVLARWPRTLVPGPPLRRPP